MMKKNYYLIAVCIPLLCLSCSTNVRNVSETKRNAALIIEKATFGVDNKMADLTKEFQLQVKNGYLYYHITRIWQDMGDPAPGLLKKLKLDYSLNGEKYSKEYKEEDIIFINIPKPSSKCSWKITSAKWGKEGEKLVDVTELLKNYVINCKMDFYVFSSISVFGDPLPRVKKFLYLEYKKDGKIYKETYVEEGKKSRILLPEQ